MAIYHNILIVGAGPGGLAVAADLQAAGHTDIALLDRGRIGQSWLDYPPETRLLSESSLQVDDNQIAGRAVQEVLPNIPHPSHEMYQKYLATVAKQIDVPIYEHAPVLQVDLDEKKMFTLQTAGGTAFSCQVLVWAAGMYTTPDERLDANECFIHYSRIQDWKHINDREVTIIGGANGATEVVLQLATPGRKLRLLCPKEFQAPTPVDCLWKENRQLVLQFQREGLVEIIEHFRVKCIHREGEQFAIESVDGKFLHSSTRPIVCIGFLPNIDPVAHLVTSRQEGHDVLLELTPWHESKQTRNLFFAGTIGKLDHEHGFIRHFRDFGKEIASRIQVD